MKELDISHLHYVPAWWSSWVMERWIWSAMSGLMFRKSVIDSLVPPMELSEDLRDLSMDTYFARFAHSVGGTLVIDSAQGGYRRHGKNKHSNNQILGGQTPSGTRDQLVRFSACQRVARHALVTRHQQLLRLLGGELYYSVAWQLMPNQDFFDFVKSHERTGDLGKNHQGCGRYTPGYDDPRTQAESRAIQPARLADRRTRR